MRKKSLRVIVVGYGKAGEAITRLLAVEANCRPVAVADPSRAALGRATSLYQLSTFPTLAKALEATDADVAVIGTPPRPAVELAAAALGQGLHVVLTKPLPDTAGVKAMAKARGRSVRFADDPVSARDALRELEAALRDTARARASPGSR